MPASYITGKSCTVTYGALDASAQVTAVNPARSASTDTTHTLGDAITIANEKEITVSLELLFDPLESGISALLHAAWVSGDKVALELDYGGAVATYESVAVSELSEAVPADGLVTQSATFVTGTADVFVWKAPTP